MKLFLVKIFFIRHATSYKMQFFRLQWGEHPIECSCQKRQCLLAKFMKSPDLFTPSSGRAGSAEPHRDGSAHANAPLKMTS
jgi:hypothetical protein